MGYKELLSRWVVLVLGAAATLVPGSPTQIFGGIPLNGPGILVAAAVVYAALGLPRPRLAPVLVAGYAALVVLKLALAATAPHLGVTATYWARATPDGAAERPAESDQRLDLSGEQFAVYFFNDAARFNFGPDVQPGRDQLPFSVRWSGWLLVPSDGARPVELLANGPARLTLDGAEVLSSVQGPGVTTVDTTLSLSAGLHALQVDYARPVARVPRLRVAWQAQPGGALEVLAAPALRARADERSDAPWRIGGFVADGALAALVLTWLALGGFAAYRRGTAAQVRAAVAAVPLVFLVQGLLVLAPVAGRATILSGLDDWLVYESSARDILLNGPLMTGGQDHAAAYYGQPLYPYVLALAHVLTGESLFGPLVLQYAALGLVVVGAFALGQRAFGTRAAGIAGMATFWALIELEPEHFKVARQLFNENLYMPLVMASLIGVVALARRSTPPRWWHALLLGGLLGVTAISRSQFLLFVPLAFVVLVIAWWRRAPAAAIAAIGLILAGTVLAIAPITWRNVAVSGQFVLISASGGASLLEFHRPPPGLIDQAALQKDPLFEALHLDTQTRTVLAFMRQDPRGYAATLLPLAAHSLGLRGRNDPGIYWPLFTTVLLYVASFALKTVRQLHVWPIHLFVLSHLVVLMLFEADTYGYRLVVPMYAPMAVIAGQLVLAALRSAMRDERRLLPAVAALITAFAVGQQVRTVAEGWSERDTAFHGLGGMAAHAARTADAASADAIYVASVDGTPRRFGAGNLPGLRYAWFKWFDPARSLPIPAEGNRAVYALAELDAHTDDALLTTCLGSGDVASEVVLTGQDVRHQCTAWADALQLGATFEGVATVDAARVPTSATAGDKVDAQLLWRPLARPADAQQVSLHLEDPQAGDGSLWGNGTLELYPAGQWDADEALVSRIPIDTDATALPQQYAVTLGIGSTKPNTPPATATWHGARVERVPVGSITLAPGSGELALPADMQPLEHAAFSGGGLQLVASRPLPAEAAAGGRLKLGLLWRADADAPVAAQAELRLVRQSGDVVQRSILPLLGGRMPVAELKAGNVVRDEETLLVSARVPSGEPLDVEIGLVDGAGQALSDTAVRLGTLKITGRQHDVQAVPADASAEATFGDKMQLVQHALEPQPAKSGSMVKVHIKWRGVAEMTQPYKVFVHVLDPGATQVVAQRDAEPKDGQAPTTSWLIGEVLDDEYAIQLPPNLAAGDYPIEVGVYEGKSGDRLLLANGDSRILLNSRLQIR